MERKRIYLASPTMHKEEQNYIKEAFDTNWIAPLGKNVNEFERETASYLGLGHALALVSGTAAIHLAVKLAGVRPGDIVLCSDLTFAASANPILYEGGIPVFIDSERETWNLNPEALNLALKKYAGRVKAVIAVNLYGTPAKLDEITALCDHAHVTLIEDAAESLSARYRGKLTGTFGTYGCISFNGNKIITTSGGGMLLSEEKEAINKARFWSTQARDEALWYQHSELGYNYRMSNVLAGIGRGQLHHLEEHKKRKKQIYERYRTGLSNLPIEMNPYLDCSEPNFWLSCMTINRETQEQGIATPEKIRKSLEKKGIESRFIWKPMHLQPLYRNRDFIHGNGEDVGGDLFRRGLCLPSDIKMTEEEQAFVIDAIKDSFSSD